MTSAKDRYDFIMGCLLQGAISNPDIFNQKAMEHMRSGGGGYLCGIVDACARIADEALDVSDGRYNKYTVSKRDPPVALKSRPIIRKELAE